MMEKFLQYVSSFRPDFRSQIRGADPARISELSILTGLQIPSPYHDFLSVMGVADAGFCLHHPARTALTEVLSYYAELTLEDRPQGLWLFAVDGYGVPDLGIVVDAAKGAPLSVYQWENGQPWVLRSQSFEKMLFQEAFARYRMRMDSPWITLCQEGRTDAKPRVLELLELQGFRSTWFSDSVMTCMEAENGTAYVSLLRNNTVFVRICAADFRWVENTAHYLIEATGLRIGQSSPGLVPS